METNTARNFALQLGSLIALYVSVSALIAIVFGVINITYPDTAEGYWAYDSAQQGIRFGIAVLIVVFPTYLLLTRFVNQIRRKETGTYLMLTKWLVYLSLLLGASILIGDLVTVILTYLNGDITLRFILKAATLLVIIGAAFYYYILDARSYWNTHESHSKMFGGAASALVIAVLVLGFLNSATPEEARQMRLDQQQVDNLSDMEWRINDHFMLNKSLPTSVDALYIGVEAPKAPEGREAYEYNVIDEDTYELCATFAQASHQGTPGVATPAMTMEGSMKNPYNNWDHAAGKTCFERTVVDYSAIKGS
jgi:hypothetical protein